jgi:hypothetical protein
MKLVHWIFLFMLMSAGVMAQDIKIVGSIDQSIKLPAGRPFLRATSPPVRHIALLKIELSDNARQKIESRVDEALNTNQAVSIATGSKIQLGMGNVPVLDQGSYGACVTFANTAAVDAVLNKGDYISQLCQLQLGRYLEKNAYTPSGWDGSYGAIVLNQMSVFGLVSKAQQLETGCGGLTTYPLLGNDFTPGTEMSPVEFHQLSEPMDNDVVAWSSVIDAYSIFLDKTDMDMTVRRVKAILEARDRLTFGVLLPSVDKGMAGAVGSHHAILDSWVLTPEIAEEMKSQTALPGHEMIITGYDDDAVAIDMHGRSHKGLFTLRNSWGSRIGDKGDFYMSYDYFKTLVVEVQRIRKI